MKEFVKMTLATLAGLLIFGFLAMFMVFGMIGAAAALGESQPVMPREAVLDIDMSKIILDEQTTEANPLDMITSGTEMPSPLGIWDAVNAINAAATDPAVKFIYLRPDGLTGQFRAGILTDLNVIQRVEVNEVVVLFRFGVGRERDGDTFGAFTGIIGPGVV